MLLLIFSLPNKLRSNDVRREVVYYWLSRENRQRKQLLQRWLPRWRHKQLQQKQPLEELQLRRRQKRVSLVITIFFQSLFHRDIFKNNSGMPFFNLYCVTFLTSHVFLLCFSNIIIIRYFWIFEDYKENSNILMQLWELIERCASCAYCCRDNDKRPLNIYRRIRQFCIVWY